MHLKESMACAISQRVHSHTGIGSMRNYMAAFLANSKPCTPTRSATAGVIRHCAVGQHSLSTGAATQEAGTRRGRPAPMTAERSG
jgi:hypothetical protein